MAGTIVTTEKLPNKNWVVILNFYTASNNLKRNSRQGFLKTKLSRAAMWLLDTHDAFTLLEVKFVSP